MLKGMSSSEVTEWQAFAQLEPFGAQIWDARFANLMALTANVMAGTEQKRFEAVEFMPDWDGSIADSIADQKELNLIEKMRGMQQRLAERFADKGVQRGEELTSPT